MTTFHVVTTCNARGWEEYGRRMVSSIYEHWPRAVRFSLYCEGFNLWKDERAPEYWAEADSMDFDFDLQPGARWSWFAMFKQRHTDNLDAHGLASGTYNFKRDAVKFGHKASVITQAAEWVQADVLIWLDADTFTHATVTREWLDAIIPPDACLSWLDRTGLYPETGVLLFRTAHPKFKPLMARFREIYETDEIFSLPETHDAYVLQHVVNELRVPWHSLSGYARNCSHPVARGPLSAVFDHRKGARKALDHSPEHAVLT